MGLNETEEWHGWGTDLDSGLIGSLTWFYVQFVTRVRKQMGCEQR